MSNLCQGCANKTPRGVFGACKKCSTVTQHMNWQLCDNCSTQLQQCKWCQGPLSGGGSVKPGTPISGIKYVTARDTDNGRKFTGMQVGEQVHIELDEDVYNGRQWAIKSTGIGLHPQMGPGIFTQNPQNYQLGTRTFVIDIRSSASGSTGTIELHEVTRTYGYWGGGGGGLPAQHGKTWKIDVQVK